MLGRTAPTVHQAEVMNVRHGFCRHARVRYRKSNTASLDLADPSAQHRLPARPEGGGSALAKIILMTIVLHYRFLT